MIIGHDLKAKVDLLRRIWKLEPPELPPETMEFQRRNPWAPFISLIMNQEINSKYAIVFPKWLYNKIGRFDGELLLELSEEEFKGILKEYIESRWPSRKRKGSKEKWIDSMYKWITEAVKMLISESKNPVTMFEDREYTVQELYFTLTRFPGLGPKKAKVTIKEFIYSELGISDWSSFWYSQIKEKRPNFKISRESIDKLDIPIDVHVRRVYRRFMRETINSVRTEDIIMFAKLVFPDLPAKLDDIFWNIGRKYCSRRNPRCYDCPLKSVCNFYLEK